MINMTKIDYVINITGASYDIVRKALLDSDGDVDVAISYIREGKYDVNIDPSKVYENEEEKESDPKGERKTGREYVDDVINYLDEILEAIKEIWRKGNASRLIVEKDNETVLSLSLTVSTFGAIIAPIASILGLTVAYITDYDFKIIMADGKIIDVREYIKNKNK